jgi:hypothetical protein
VENEDKTRNKKGLLDYKFVSKGRKTQASNFSMGDKKAPNALNDILNTEQNLTKLIKQALKKLDVDLLVTSPDRQDIDEMAKVMGVSLSPYQSTEALYFARNCT